MHRLLSRDRRARNGMPIVATIAAACLATAGCGPCGPPASLEDPIVSVAAPGAAPEYADLADVPGTVLGPLGGAGGSSVASFEGGTLLVGEREEEGAEGLVVFRLRPEQDPVGVERVWTEALGAAVAGIEASAVRGDRLYLQGSHAHDRSGELDPRRQVMLRIDAGAPPGILVKRVWLRAYLARVLPWVPELAASMTRRPVEPERLDEQIRIEGLAAVPETSDLLLGLRSPQSDASAKELPGCGGAAIVLRLHDADAIFDRESHPRLSAHAFLCMDQRGVASLEFDPVSRSYLLAATGPAGGPTQSGLWRWDPRPCGGGRLEELMRFPAHRLTGVTRLGADTAYPGKVALAFERELLVLDLPLEDRCAGAGG